MFYVRHITLTPFTSRCRVYRSTAQVLTKDAFVKVQFNAEQYDEKSEFDSTTNYRWTCKATGKYHIDAGVGIDDINAGETAWIYVKLNGTTYIFSAVERPGFSGPIVPTVSGDYLFTLDDFIEIYILHTDTTDQNTFHTYGNPWLNVHRIG